MIVLARNAVVGVVVVVVIVADVCVAADGVVSIVDVVVAVVVDIIVISVLNQFCSEMLSINWVRDVRVHLCVLYILPVYEYVHV